MIGSKGGELGRFDTALDVAVADQSLYIVIALAFSANYVRP